MNIGDIIVGKNGEKPKIIEKIKNQKNKKIKINP